MEQSLNYYDILGISRDAALEEIKKSYKKLALIYHPDVNPDQESQEHFKEISRAYQTLSHPEMKKIYDDELHPFHELNFIKVFKYSYKKFSEKTEEILEKLKKTVYSLTKKQMKIQYQAANSVHISNDIVNMSVDELGVRLVYSSNEFVRAHAATALGIKKDKSGYYYLEKKILDDSLEVRRAVIWAIGNLRLKKSIDLLADLYELCHSVIRVDIIKAVGNISGFKGNSYQKLLEKGLSDENLLIRKCVLNHLMSQNTMSSQDDMNQLILRISKDYKIPVETIIYTESFMRAGGGS